MLCLVSLFSGSQSAAERDEDFSLHTSPETHLAIAGIPAQAGTLPLLYRELSSLPSQAYAQISIPPQEVSRVSNSSTSQNTEGEVMKVTWEGKAESGVGQGGKRR